MNSKIKIIIISSLFLMGIYYLYNLKISTHSRSISISFSTQTYNDSIVEFTVKKKNDQINLAELNHNIFSFKNKTKDTLYFRPYHIIKPVESLDHYKMLKCFCFDDMILLGMEERELELSYLFETGLDSSINHINIQYALLKRDKFDVLTDGDEL